MTVEGIRDLELEDLNYALELGYRIKLLGVIKNVNGAVEMSVRPTLVPQETLLAGISDVFNGVMVEGDCVGQTLFYGRGAGRQATASAVVADIADVALNYATGSTRRIPAFRQGELFESVTPQNECTSRYYLRLIVEDCPGVIASITKILADREISISSLIQHENQGENVSLVILTHPAMEKEIRSAMEEMSKLSVSRAAVKMLRIEEF
jgi:homoserine dehydrogenase